jgi:glucose-6-phosphate isomerase
MLKINFQDLQISPEPKKYERELHRIAQSGAPSFETNQTDLKVLENQIKKFKKYKNVILIANGGSRTSARAFYYGLADFRNKVNFKFVTSPEPRAINALRKIYAKKDTLILVISHSGSNINNIEPLLLFLDYPVLVITGAQKSPLRDMAEKKKWTIIVHPEVEGRFSAITTCALAPALLMGLDAKKLISGAKAGYQNYSAKMPLEKNDALKLALYFAELGNKGYGEIFASVYSSSLVAILPLLVQLVHETYGKNGRGQTIFGDYSPESQHHTNQRFFGGPKNVIGLFMSEEKMDKDLKIKVPALFKKIIFRGTEMGKLDGLSAGQTLQFDKAGVLQNCRNHKMPAMEMAVDRLTQESFAQTIVFWQYFVVYSAMLRNLNPYDQPEVEAAKKISLELRLARKK